jgi:hypothetical protein
MASNDSGAGEGTELREAADLLQQQLVYNGQVLDAALDALRIYKDGTQSLTFLRASVHLAYALMRMLEKWAKVSGDGSYVRKRAKPKKKRKTAHGTEEPDSIPDVEEEQVVEAQPEGEVIEETMFTFDAFELVRGAHSRLGPVLNRNTEICKRGHHTVAVDLFGALQRVHVARRDETHRQLVASASDPGKS